MRCVDGRRRPYEVSRSRPFLPVLFFLVVLCLCFNGVHPHAVIDTQANWFRVVLNPWFDAFALLALLSGWLGAKNGVYVGDAGVMVRVGFRRVVVPWQEIAYAMVAEVPKFPVILQRGPSLGLVVVAPSGYGRPLPVRLPAVTLRWGRGGPPYVVLTQQYMTQVVNRINELAARHHPRPWPPPPGGWPFPPR